MKQKTIVIFVLFIMMVFCFYLGIQHREQKERLPSFPLTDSLSVSRDIQKDTIPTSMLQTLAGEIGEIQSKISLAILDSGSSKNDKKNALEAILPEAETIGKRMGSLDRETQEKIVQLFAQHYPKIFAAVSLTGTQAMKFAKIDPSFAATYEKLSAALSGRNVQPSIKRE
jgi:hypothetical protein